MGSIEELSPIKACLGRRHQGLRKLSPDLIGKARDETASQVTRIGLTFLGTTAFCLLSLPSPDSALLFGSEKINVPLAGPVSFLGFMLLGPAVLIALRFYLQLYVEHSARLDQIARSVSAVRAPTFLPLDNAVIRLFSGLIFYVLLPVTMLLFAWKAAVFFSWGTGLLCVALVVIASHVMLWLNRFRRLWPLSLKVETSVGAVIIVGVVFSFVVPEHPPGVRRHFNLDRANLSDQSLFDADLRDAHLSGANLRGANLSAAKLTYANLTYANLTYANLTAAKLIDAYLARANLSGADLVEADLNGAHLLNADLTKADLTGANLSGVDLLSANLGGADLSGANLSGADLTDADLTKANLSRADLTKANLSRADLSDAVEITQTQLDEACGNERTRLPEGLTLKPCPQPP
jgi:Pentapeptide repeats (8 copies)